MKYIIAVLFSLFVSTSFVYAQIVITEIMYDPQSTEGEWLEVYNNGDSEIDLKNWKVFDGSNHTVPSVIIPAGGYAILSDTKTGFLSIYPNTIVPVIDIVTAFNNDGDIVILRDASGSDQSTVGYTATSGANKNGKTLQLLNGVFLPGTPSVGGPTTLSAAETTNASSTGSNNTNTNSTNTVSPTITNSSSGNINPFRVLPNDQQVFASAGGNRVVVAGAPVTFNARVVTSSSRAIQGSDILWSFGDGGTSKTSKTTHIFSHPGVYVVLLEASADEYIAKDHILVEVISPQFTISAVSTTSPQYIELENNSNYEIDLGGWILQVNGIFGRSFPIPNNTYILPHRKIIFPSELTGLDGDSNIITLLFPNAKVVTEYKKIKPLSTLASSTDSIKEEVVKKNEPEDVTKSVFTSIPEKVNEVLSNTILRSVFSTTKPNQQQELIDGAQAKEEIITVSTTTNIVQEAIDFEEKTSQTAAVGNTLNDFKYKNYFWVAALFFGILALVSLIRFTDNLEKKDLKKEDDSDSYTIIE